MDRAARPTASSGYRDGASSNAAALCCSRPWLPAEGGPPRAPPLPAASSAAPASSSPSSSSPSSSSSAPSSHASSSTAAASSAASSSAAPASTTVLADARQSMEAVQQRAKT
jgi:hypothetical protein